MSNRKIPFSITVRTVEQYSKSIKRFVFEDNSKRITKLDESAYLKLHLQMNDSKTVKRSYTIREVDERNNTVIIDFVIHGENGPASKWAMNAKSGDQLIVTGPGPTKLIDLSCDWFMLIGDMTSLPAIAANTKLLPANAKGYIIIGVAHKSDIQLLNLPAGMKIDWVVNSDTNNNPKIFLELIQSKQWYEGKPYIWMAGEFNIAKNIRQFFKEKKVAREHRYISSYWKSGETDEGHKQAKKLEFSGI